MLSIEVEDDGDNGEVLRARWAFFVLVEVGLMWGGNKRVMAAAAWID